MISHRSPAAAAAGNAAPTLKLNDSYPVPWRGLDGLNDEWLQSGANCTQFDASYFELNLCSSKSAVTIPDSR